MSYTGLLIDLAKECAQDASRASAIQPTTSPNNDNNHPHEKHWFGSISSEPHNAFHKVFRSKNIGASMPPPIAVDGIAPMIPHTWEEWQSSYGIIHNTTATPILSYAIYGSSVHDNHSVFWSPLLVSSFFLHPLKELIKKDKMNEDSSKKADFMVSKPDKVAGVYIICIVILFSLVFLLQDDKIVLYIYVSGFGYSVPLLSAGRSYGCGFRAGQPYVVCDPAPASWPAELCHFSPEPISRLHFCLQ